MYEEYFCLVLTLYDLIGIRGVEAAAAAAGSLHINVNVIKTRGVAGFQFCNCSMECWTWAGRRYHGIQVNNDDERGLVQNQFLAHPTALEILKCEEVLEPKPRPKATHDPPQSLPSSSRERFYFTFVWVAFALACIGIPILLARLCCQSIISWHRSRDDHPNPSDPACHSIPNHIMTHVNLPPPSYKESTDLHLGPPPTYEQAMAQV
ncbi:uncharacterized protein LOC131882674 [Tigriopus californicus]|uniref:uncharacterized protein LOC131882674 n=1 Tax=Tigriopus californicus TaxID=6832 RepID=UPI0027DA111B|nr:uncharacterized protein LOC131882674 [Tigriopus californicus]